jgi:hypothetical protein
MVALLPFFFHRAMTLVMGGGTQTALAFLAALVRVIVPFLSIPQQVKQKRSTIGFNFLFFALSEAPQPPLHLGQIICLPSGLVYTLEYSSQSLWSNATTRFLLVNVLNVIYPNVIHTTDSRVEMKAVAHLALELIQKCFGDYLRTVVVVLVLGIAIVQFTHHPNNDAVVPGSGVLQYHSHLLALLLHLVPMNARLHHLDLKAGLTGNLTHIR